MENRERDRVSQRTSPTEAGELNRSIEEEKGRRQHSGTTAEFGQNIGESEFPNEEGGRMRNRKQEDMNSNSNVDRESTRRPGQEYGSSSGRRPSGSSNEIGSDRSSDIDSRSSRRGSSDELGSTGISDRSDRSDRSEGRH
jgi:hypothetical protein